MEKDCFVKSHHGQSDTVGERGLVDEAAGQGVQLQILAKLRSMAMRLETCCNVDPYKEIHRPFKNKSSWKPNPPNRTLDTYKRAFKMNLLNSKVKQCHQHNLTKEQWKGLMELRKNPEIVIKKADKGSAVVIMNTTDYLREGYRQLSDCNFYVKIREDPTEQISEKICKVLTEMKIF